MKNDTTVTIQQKYSTFPQKNCVLQYLFMDYSKMPIPTF